MAMEVTSRAQLRFFGNEEGKSCWDVLAKYVHKAPSHTKQKANSI